jgi:hypothetical protein
MVAIINPIIPQIKTPYSEPETRTVGVWHVTDQFGNEKTISVKKENKLKYSQDQRSYTFYDHQFEYSDYLRTPEKPRDEREGDTEDKKLELRSEKDQYEKNLLKVRKQRPIHSIFLIDNFRSIIQENIQDCVRHQGSIGDSRTAFLNFLPVIEKQGYIATPERGKRVYKPLKNINVALFGMFDIITKTMIFARWGVFNRETEQTQSIPVHDGGNNDAFEFLKNFCKTNNFKKGEEFGKRFKPILEMDDERILNIRLYCFSDLEENTMMSDMVGAITIISKKCTASGYNTGHSMIFYEYVDFKAFKHVKKIAHLKAMAGGRAKVDILEGYWVTKNIERQGPTWIRPIEDIKRLEASMDGFVATNKMFRFDISSFSPEQKAISGSLFLMVGWLISPVMALAPAIMALAPAMHSLGAFDISNTQEDVRKIYNCSTWTQEQMKTANIFLSNHRLHTPATLISSCHEYAPR